MMVCCVVYMAAEYTVLNINSSKDYNDLTTGRHVCKHDYVDTIS